jgi:thioredoxin reductase (NADPH)
MEEAIFLSKFADKVTVVNRRDEFRASKIMLERARAQANIEFVTPYTVKEFVAGENGTLGHATLTHAETGEEREIPVSGVFIAVGHEPQSALVRGQVDVDESGYVVTQGKSTRTKLPGVFAAGDLVDHTDHRRRLRLSGGARRRVVPARHARDPDPAGHDARRSRRSSVGARRRAGLLAEIARAAVAVSAQDRRAGRARTS